MPPEQPLLGAVVSLLPSLHVEDLRAGRHSAQGTAACSRAPKTSFQWWAETKHTSGASTR